MAKIILLVFCALFSSAVMAEQSREECWLDNLPGTKNDVVAQQILMDCSKYNPYIGEKSDGWFGGKTMSWCIRKYGEDTVSQRAAMIIRAACFKLYENK
jgi:hypothetical protein